MSDVDTLRWGDTHQFTFDPSALGRFTLASKQMVSAKWRRPLGWICNIAADPQFDAFEAGTFTIAARITQGVGGGLITSVRTNVLAIVGGIYTPIFDTFQLAAQDIQIDIALSTTNAVGHGPEAIQVGVFVAPITEPHSMAAMLDQTPGGLQQPRRFMDANPAEGFQDEPLRYQR